MHQALVALLEMEAIATLLMRPLLKAAVAVVLCIQLEQQEEHTSVMAAVMVAILRATQVMFYVLVPVVPEAIVAMAETVEPQETLPSQRAVTVQAAEEAVVLDLDSLTEPVRAAVLGFSVKGLTVVGEHTPQMTETRVLEAQVETTA